MVVEYYGHSILRSSRKINFLYVLISFRNFLAGLTVFHVTITHIDLFKCSNTTIVLLKAEVCCRARDPCSI